MSCSLCSLLVAQIMVSSCCVMAVLIATLPAVDSCFCFPTDVARRRRRIAALRRVEPYEKPWEARQTHRVCSDHFHLGRPPDPPHPDFAPSLRMGYTWSTSTSSQRPAEHGASVTRAPSLERSHRRKHFSAKRVAAMAKAGEERALHTAERELNRR